MRNNKDNESSVQLCQFIRLHRLLCGRAREAYFVVLIPTYTRCLQSYFTIRLRPRLTLAVTLYALKTPMLENEDARGLSRGGSVIIVCGEKLYHNRMGLISVLCMTTTEIISILKLGQRLLLLLSGFRMFTVTLRRERILGFI
uniref:Transmembrane protein n=1 Tax=Heterorhabditis bacteriophora TaxID=37862 RepID=A0A1I7W9E1_HETBA